MTESGISIEDLYMPIEENGETERRRNELP